MNVVFTRFFKSIYRKEPISSFLAIVAATDLVIGGIGSHWTLFSFGLIIALTGGLVRWKQVQKSRQIQVKNQTRYLLPPSSSRPALPMLISNKNHR